MTMHHIVVFEQIASAALAQSETIVLRWLPTGKRSGQEWISLNPRRPDRKVGSFKVNLETGRWADFSSGDKGGDLISLAAYLFGLSQIEAARKVSEMIGVSPHHG